VEKVLIAAPTAKVKDYALERYVAASKAFTYEHRHHLIIDTTYDDGEHAEMLRGLDFAEILAVPSNPSVLTLAVTQAWEKYIIPHAWALEYDYILSLESDIIAPPETVDFLLDAARQFEAAIVGHSYERRRNPQVYPLSYAKGLLRQSLGCTMFKTNVIESGENCLDYFEVYLWDKARYLGLPMVHLENVLTLEHLWSPRQDETTPKTRTDDWDNLPDGERPNVYAP
jgi:hypothetical protein